MSKNNPVLIRGLAKTKNGIADWINHAGYLIFRPAYRHMHTISKTLQFERNNHSVVTSVVINKQQRLTFGNLAFDTWDFPEQIVVVGSGPSIGNLDLSGLSADSTLLCNGAISLLRGVISKPFAIAIEDRRFVQRHWPLIRDTVEPNTLCIFSADAISQIATRDPKWLFHRRVLFSDNLLKPVALARRTIDKVSDHLIVQEQATAISVAPSTGVIPAGSVAVTAFQWSLAMRPNRIGFAGVELWNASQPRFYESSHEMAASGIEKAQNRILDHIALGVKIAKSNQCQVVNYSPGSALGEIGIEYQAHFSKITTI